jgi:hypothetical protein
VPVCLQAGPTLEGAGALEGADEEAHATGFADGGLGFVEGACGFADGDFGFIDGGARGVVAGGRGRSVAVL